MLPCPLDRLFSLQLLALAFTGPLLGAQLSGDLPLPVFLLHFFTIEFHAQQFLGLGVFAPASLLIFFLALDGVVLELLLLLLQLNLGGAAELRAYLPQFFKLCVVFFMGEKTKKLVRLSDMRLHCNKKPSLEEYFRILPPPSWCG